MASPAVEFCGVSKRFHLGESAESLGGMLLRRVRRVLRPATPAVTDFWALREVTIEAAPGEAIGVIGPNGAGKSTVLKLLAGILRPDEGQVRVRGRLAALLEIGAGFHGDLTGRENIFLNGSILGMSRREIRGKLDAIVAFAGLERFLETPVKRYSSGMYARLGFAIAAHVEPRVLLVDEVLSVGDALFRLRCMERMQELIRGGATLVFVTHQLDQMQSVCGRAIVLESGRKVFEGDPRSAVSHYMTAVTNSYAERPTDIGPRQASRGETRVAGLRFLDQDGAEVAWARPGESLSVEVTLMHDRPIPGMVLELNLRSESQVNLLSLNSGRDGVNLPGGPGMRTIMLHLSDLPVCGGQYYWNVRIWDAERGTTELDTPFQYALGVDDGGRATGLLTLDHEWTTPDVSVPATVRSGEPERGERTCLASWKDATNVAPHFSAG